jgi:hypothetical protein
VLHAGCMLGKTRGTHALCRVLRQAQQRLARAAAAWAGALGHWLAWAYALEHAGWSVYAGVWAASLAFLGAQAALLCALLPRRLAARGCALAAAPRRTALGRR